MTVALDSLLSKGQSQLERGKMSTVRPGVYWLYQYEDSVFIWLDVRMMKNLETLQVAVDHCSGGQCNYTSIGLNTRPPWISPSQIAA